MYLRTVVQELYPIHFSKAFRDNSVSVTPLPSREAGQPVDGTSIMLCDNFFSVGIYFNMVTNFLC